MKKIALINPADLIAQELKEQLGQISSATDRVTLLSTNSEEVGVLTDLGGAAAVVQRFTDEEAEGIDLAFLCGPIADGAEVLEKLPAEATLIIASLDGAESHDLGEYAVAGVSRPASGNVLVSPHPAVVHLAYLLGALSSLGIRAATSSVVQPTSLFGTEALDELMEQTRKVLSFHTPGGGEHFERQIVFNLLPTDDNGSAETQLRNVLRGVDGAPDDAAVQLIQGGVFHGTSVSLRLDFADEVSTSEITEALASDVRIQIVHDLAPGPVDAAATDRVLVSPPRAVTSRPGSFWLWSVMDNVTRGAAMNALELAGFESPKAN